MKFLLKENHLKTGIKTSICFVDIQQDDICNFKIYLSIIQKLEDVELSLKKVDDADIVEINLNRYLKK